MIQWEKKNKQVYRVKVADARANKRAGRQAKMDDGWC